MDDHEKSREALLAEVASLRAQVAAQAGARTEDERIRLLAALVQHASDLVLVVAGDTTIQYASPSAEPLLGYRPDELGGMRGLDLVHPDDLPLAETTLRQAFDEADAVLRLELRLRRKDGAWRTFDVRGRSLLHDPTTRAIVGNLRDITDRKEIELALQQSDERYRAFIAQSSEGIWRYELERPLPIALPELAQIEHIFQYGYLAECNDAMARMYGYDSAQALVGTRTGDLLPPNDPANLAMLRAFIRSGYRLLGAESHEYDLQGNSRYFLNNFVGIVAGGQLVRAWGTQRDITPRKEAESALLEAKRQLEIILGGVADGITAQDPTGMLIYANDAAARVSGYPSAQAFLAASPTEILSQFEVMNEEGQPISLSRLPGRRALQGEETPDAILRFRIRATGEERWSVVKATPVFDEQGRVQFAINIFRDFTERKQLEDDLRFLAEASALLAASLDYETTLRDVTRLVLGHLADFCVVDLVGPTGELEHVALAATHPEQETVLREIHAHYLPPQRVGPLRVLASGQSEFYGNLSEADLSRDIPDPHYLALLRTLSLQSVLIVPLQVRGRILGTLTLATTGTRRRYRSSDLALAEEVGRRAAVAVDNARLYQEAQQAIKLYKQFLAVASHELKTPLTTIQGYAGLLQRRMEKAEVVDEGLLHHSQLIHSETERLTRLIDLLLDFSRLQSGTLRLTLEMVDLTALVARLVVMWQPTLTHHRLQVEGGNEALVVQGDPLRLEQILLNLLTNAVKYSPDGGAITLRLERAARFARVVVTDHGVGISATHLDHLFDEFYRIESPTTQRIPGMGLGLYIVRHLVEAHGGSVEVVSQEGQGSTFTVVLPLALPSAGEQGCSPTPTP